MGDNLYENKYFFIRELLQNALDTSRHREFYEQNNGQVNFKADAINVSTWHDDDGYRWVRFDDYGMGMTLSQIKSYFLKVGNSYYNSDEFKVHKLKYAEKGEDFTPISRFGIGILSCFIVADLVEVSTKTIETESPVRLSLKGMHNYYVMQTNSDIANSIPNENNTKEGYRTKVGTSIAVRLKPNYDTFEFDVEKQLEDLLFRPTVPVLFKGKPKGEFKYTYLDETEIDIYNTNKDFKIYIDSIAEKLPELVEFRPKLNYFTIDLSRRYKHPNIKGLLHFFYINRNIYSVSHNDALYISNKEKTISLINNIKNIQLSFSLKTRRHIIGGRRDKSRRVKETRANAPKVDIV